jgi:uncharacterized protein
MSGLPQYLAPIRLAERGEEIAGEIAVCQMLRLRKSLHDGSGSVRVSVYCVPGESGTIRIRGSLDTTLKLECQRCLGVFDLPLHVNIDAGAAMETADSPAAEADVIMQGEDRLVHLAALVEDELILALPLAPLHAPGQCPVTEYAQGSRPQRDSPFAALEQLKVRKQTTGTASK